MVCRFRPADRQRRSDNLGFFREEASRDPLSVLRRLSVWGDSANSHVPSGGVGAAHPTTALSGALVLIQATPGAVLLWTGDGVVKAVEAYRAARADLLGLALPDVPLWLPLTVWAEEEHQILATTRGRVLPT